MSKEERIALMKVLITADGGCGPCVTSIFEEAIEHGLLSTDDKQLFKDHMHNNCYVYDCVLRDIFKEVSA